MHRRRPIARRSRFCPFLVLVVVALAGGACGATSAESAGPTVIDGWDPLVQEYVEFVQEVRGEPFTGTAEVSFMDPEQVGSGPLSGSKPRASERSERTDDLYRALGLATEDFDVLAEQQKLTGRPSAFYDIGRRRIMLPSPDGERMQEVPVTLQPVLVHELTHALQAQTRFGRIQAIADTELRLALVEGEASWVFDQYVATFDDVERERWRDGSQLVGDLPDVPEVIHADNLISYELGAAFFTARHAQGGREGIDAVFTELPTSTAAILDPFGLDNDSDAPGVQPPDDGIRDEHRQVAIGAVANLSPFRIFQMLAAAIPTDEALLATRAVSSFALPLAWIDHDRFCLAATVGTVDPDAELLEDAFDRWVSLAPDVRSVSNIDDGLLIRACDPGLGQVPAPAIGAMEALRRAAFLIEGEARAVALALEPSVGFCMAWALVESRDAPLAFDSRYELKTLELEDVPTDCRSR